MSALKKQDYSPKPKFPTHGLKVIPAPKLEFDKSALKKNFDKKQFNNRFNDRDRDLEEHSDRFEDNHNNQNPNNRNQFNHRINEERVNRNRLNNYNTNADRLNDKNNDRVRQSDNWSDNSPSTVELPEKDGDRPLNEEDYDDRGSDSLPPLKPVLKVGTIVRHVYGAKAPLDSDKPTIPPRYLKSISDIPSASGSNPEKYDNSDDGPRPTLSKIPSLSEILPPINEQGVSYKTEPVVTHKYVNMGDVYRKANVEEDTQDSRYNTQDSGHNTQDFRYNTQDSGQNTQEETFDSDAGPLAGYGKDPYDKQLISTLTKLMATSKNRHPLNIGGLDGTDSSKQTSKPLTSKSTKQYFTSSPSGQTSSQMSSLFKDDFFQPKTSFQTSFQSSGTASNQQFSPQSQYSSQSSTGSQSRIPESLLSPFSFRTTGSGSQSSVTSENLSTSSQQMVPLRPGQVPVLPEVHRKAVSLDLDYNTGVRPLSPDSYFESTADEYGSSAQSYSSASQLSKA